MMFGFRRHKFTKKCQADIKTLKARLEAIKRKRNSVIKYLKNVVADLLNNGLDINAYGRAEGVLVEQNMTTCYQLTESFLDCILSNLSQMQNQSECPEECKEAVSSVIYAAARFSDLPELRDLRSIFTEKYGDSIAAFVNKELRDKFKVIHATKEMKVQLMHHIAKEHLIEWDSKALEQKLFTPPPANKASQCDSDVDVYISQKTDNALSKRKSKGERGRYGTDDADNYKLHSSSDDETTDVSHDGRMTASSSVGSRSEDEAENKAPSSYMFTPPPYYKPKSQNTESGYEESRKASAHAVDANAKPRSVRKASKPKAGNDPKNEEDKVMHYSQKGSPYDPRKTKENLKPRNHQSDEDANESTRQKSSMSEVPKMSARVNSFQPEVHVHPRLPEYDDLAARIAALRGV